MSHESQMGIHSEYGFQNGYMRFALTHVSHGLVAQLVEQGTENPRVVGSIPTGGTFICGFSSFGRARPCQGGGGGFEPRNPLQKIPHDVRDFFFAFPP